MHTYVEIAIYSDLLAASISLALAIKLSQSHAVWHMESCSLEI